MIRLVRHPLAGNRIHVCEAFGEPSWTGILLGGLREFGTIKYAIVPDNESYFILVDPGVVYIWLAKEQPEDNPLPKNVLRFYKKLRK